MKSYRTSGMLQRCRSRRQVRRLCCRRLPNSACHSRTSWFDIRTQAGERSVHPWIENWNLINGWLGVDDDEEQKKVFILLQMISLKKNFNNPTGDENKYLQKETKPKFLLFCPVSIGFYPKDISISTVNSSSGEADWTSSSTIFGDWNEGFPFILSNCISKRMNKS